MLFIIVIFLALVFYTIIDCNIDKSKNDGLIIVCMIGFIATVFVSVVGGINLCVDLIIADSKQAELELLYNQSVELIEAKDTLEYKFDFDEENFNSIVYEKVQAYNKLLDYCKSQNNSILFGDFLDWGFCESYKPITIKNNRDYILTS